MICDKAGRGGALLLFVLLAAGCSVSEKAEKPASPEAPSKPAPESPSQALSLYNRAIEEVRAGRLGAAVPLLQGTLRAQPDLYLAHLALGDIYRKQGKRKEARLAYRRVLALKPDHPESHVALGQLAETARSQELALHHYEKAVRARPEFFLARFRLGVLRFHRKQYAAAVSNLRVAARLRPEHSGARYWLWLSLAERGEAADWEVALGRKIVVSGDTTPVTYYRGRAAALYRAKRYEAALETIQRAVGVNPNWRDPRWKIVLDEMARYKRAIERAGNLTGK
ncbi:MAG: tetratricopeptide repeat protein [bacterium]|nr:tetratricopeptide repeat protein [bacterium]